MDQDHEYAVLGGVNRAAIGRYLSLVAATASSVLVFFILTLVDLARKMGWPESIPPSIMSLVGAGTIFVVLYWFFSRFAWRWGPLSRALKVPDLTGRWQCSGQTLNPDGSKSFGWNGEIHISQNWDKIQVRLKTDKSTSNSITAALLCDALDGYRLLYNYRNVPQIGQVNLNSHIGFADILFAKDRETAKGEYFNGHGRFTFGTIELRRD